MASAVSDYQNVQDPELVPRSEQEKVLEDLVDILRFVNFRKYENRLINIIRDNPWMLRKINIFLKNEEHEFKKAKEESEKKLAEKKEFRNLSERLDFIAELKLKKWCLQEIDIGLHFALLMKQIYEISFEYSDESRKLLLETEKKLLSLMKKYEKRWEDRVPSLSFANMHRIRTGELEIHFCRQKFKTRYHEREHEPHRMDQYELYTPTSTQMETDCSMHPVSEHLIPHLQRINQRKSLEELEELLSMLDMNM